MDLYIVLDTAPILPPGAEANYAIRDATGPLVPLLEAVTHLGDGAFLIALAILLYWFGRSDSRRKRAWVLAIGTVAFAVAAGVKGFFAAPRPALLFAPDYYPGYSFPSAHALGAAAFYGALAASMSIGTRRQRYAIAGVIIAIVALSRVVLGVHFVGDVVIGVALGIAIVAVGLRMRGYDPGPLFAAAAVIAVAAYVAGSREYTTLTIGAALGGMIGWSIVRDRQTTDTGAAVLLLGVGVIAGLLILRWISYMFAAVTTLPVFGVPLINRAILEIVGYSVLTAMMLMVPAWAIIIEDHPLVRRLQSTLPFRGRRVDPSTSLGEMKT